MVSKKRFPESCKESPTSSCGEISACNNKIARGELPIVSSDENDLIGTSYYGSWPQSACLLRQNSKNHNYRALAQLSAGGR
jgi:hypothetical protein